MMQRVIYIAIALLLLQLGLAVGLNLKNLQPESTTLHSHFLALSPSQVTSLEISAADGKQVKLSKGEKGWFMPENFNGQADGQKIDELLQKLSEVKQGLAVATSPQAAQRFKTDDKSFERHIVVKEKDTTVADFYLGTSAGFRYSHVRKADQDDIITIPVSSFEVEAENDQWLDKNQVHLKKEDISKVQLKDIDLIKENDRWQLVENGEETLNESEIEKLIDKISSIPIQSILDPEKVSADFGKAPDIELRVHVKGGEDIVFTFLKQEDHHVLKISNNERYFKVNNWQVESLQDFTLAKLTNGENMESEKSSTPDVPEEEKG